MNKRYEGQEQNPRHVGVLDNATGVIKANQATTLEQLNRIRNILGMPDSNHASILEPVKKSLEIELNDIKASSAEIVSCINDIAGILIEQFGENMTLK